MGEEVIKKANFFEKRPVCVHVCRCIHFAILRKRFKTDIIAALPKQLSLSDIFGIERNKNKVATKWQ